MLPSLRSRVVPVLVSVVLAACGGGNVASQIAKAPDFAPKSQAKCSVARSQAKPLIVEWPSPERMELENKVRRGVVVVHYVGCEMSVLDRCSVPAKYTYQGATRNQDKVEMKDEDELYANLPVGAARLEGKLQRTGRLTVDMNLVGRFEADTATVRADQLQGECDGATHFVYGVTVGAFDFYAGGEADVGGSAGVGGIGGGGRSQAQRETLTKAGDEGACSRATPDDRSPPAQCGALIRIEVVALGEAKALEATCPKGTQWNGSACLAKTVQCPGSTTWNGSDCVAAGPPPSVRAVTPESSRSDAPATESLRPGDHVQFVVKDSAADWTGENAYVSGCSGTCSRLSFYDGYCSGNCVVAKVRNGFFTLTRWDTLYAPVSSAKKQ